MNKQVFEVKDATMKKSLLFTCLICAALLLSACASSSSAGDGGAASAGSGFGGARRPTGLASIFSIFTGGTRSFTFTPEEKLAVGTIKLDAAGKSIDRAEAGKLLPLWQLLHQLYSSSSPAPEEEAAVVDAIRSAMPPDQVAAIDSMQMSRGDLFTTFQQGQTSGSSSGTNGTGAARAQNFTGGNGSRRNGAGGQGFFFGGPAGGFAGGGLRPGSATGNGTGNAATTTTQQSINSAERAQAATNNLTNALINQVISLLQDKLSS